MGKWQISMDPVQEWGEEVEDGVVYGVTLHRICDPADLTDPTHSSESRPRGCVQYRTLKVRRLKAATLQRLVTELVKPECDEPDYPRIFLSTYRAFTCTSTLIQLLFQREDMITNLDSSVCIRSSLPPLVRLWLDEFWEDFRDSPQHQALRLLCVHLRHRLCFRRLARQAEALLHSLQEEDKRAEVEGSEVSSAPAVDRSCGERSLGLDRVETGSLLSFSARDIAEQLTRLDADLFVRVVPFHCLGCVWSQRDKKENRSLAPTVRATIAQFNAVTNWVITSLLCPNSTSAPGSPSIPRSPKSPRSPRSPRPPRSPRSPQMCRSAQCPLTSPVQRARIIEKWISVAQECHQLRNLSSLRAILSALQSNAIYRLKKTWAVVSRESVATFEQLCESFPDENCVLTTREILEEDGARLSAGNSSSAPKSPKLSPSARHMSCSSGEVPYLGTYLTVLTMLDTALPDTVEGGLINFEKRRREFEILSHIRVLQASCSLYSFPSHPAVCSWLRNCTPLSDQQSYDLSRELEPPVDPCPNSPSFWSQRLIGKKISSLLSSEKAHADQISVSSSGSSGSEMDDLPPLRHKPQSGSLQNISTDSAVSSASSSPQPDHSALSSDIASPTPSSSSSSSSCAALSHPVFNKEVGDSCIIRVSMELDIGNVYKSILITSQDKTSQVVQRALAKHNLENMSCSDFSLVQILPHDKELLLPDKANVFYAMCPSESYDFVLRQRWRSHVKAPVSCSSPAAVPRGRLAK
ncbi:ral guanine nucleotide dissociation stimulator-like 1 [Colossoma macropomum]|uniref:ral guanine nucleotide dissociation stimulator-like 1 n=1 Tax=Colossoma macropomum TaxID=42526 RepID=UPI00186459E6|nr:ral guanine nucleotide dissociation stimulator-like 1 [Colossoma macropomum]